MVFVSTVGSALIHGRPRVRWPVCVCVSGPITAATSRPVNSIVMFTHPLTILTIWMPFGPDLGERGEQEREEEEGREEEHHLVGTF